MHEISIQLSADEKKALKEAHTTAEQQIKRHLRKGLIRRGVGFIKGFLRASIGPKVSDKSIPQ